MNNGIRLAVLLLAGLLAAAAGAQEAVTSPDSTRQQLTPALQRLQSVDTASGTPYVLLTLDAGKAPARLMAQCTTGTEHSQRFELFIDFNGTAALTFHEHHKRLPTEPPVLYTNLTLDFRGYTHVKPFRREFEIVANGLLRYNPPGVHSHNLEEAAWFLQYLRALPTLVVTEPTHPEHAATFDTVPLLAQLSKEPLCKASGL